MSLKPRLSPPRTRPPARRDSPRGRGGRTTGPLKRASRPTYEGKEAAADGEVRLSDRASKAPPSESR